MICSIPLEEGRAVRSQPRQPCNRSQSPQVQPRLGICRRPNRRLRSALADDISQVGR
jgi:hypothetical protein